MQFKYPELLWALLLLLIPIIIHLFQLRRFRRTAFTNVRLLEKVVAKTRKSRSLKKWLLLLTRMLMITALVLAFAEPFIAAENALIKKVTAIYIDNSFSMQARTEKGDLLEVAIQDLMSGLPANEAVTIITNDRTFVEVSPAEIKNELLRLPHTYRQLNMDEVILKAHAVLERNSAIKRQLLAISDFQRSMFTLSDSIADLDLHLVQLLPEPIGNIALDTLYMNNATPTQLELKLNLTSTGEVEDTPVSIWNADTLIAKTAANFKEDGSAEVVFNLPQNTVIDGRIEISDSGINYDNQLFFNFNLKPRIKVMVVGSGPSEFLERIFVEDEFELRSFELNNLNYSDIDNQNIIILNQLEAIPNSLVIAMRSFTEAGGSLVVIPGPEIDSTSYNGLLMNYFSSSYDDYVDTEQLITTIVFEHPLYDNVFEKSISNFQYPKVATYYKLSSRAPTVLRLQNGDPFLAGDRGFYLFTAPIDQESSNFRNSPLVVPSFYNMGTQSLKLPSLYHPLSSSTRIDIPVSLRSDEIARVVKDDYEFIPLQQSFTNRTTISFEEHPSEDGIFNIVLNDSLISRISFNYPRLESDLNYADISTAPVNSTNSEVEALLDDLENENRVKQLWQWFVILALLFALTEVLVQKLVK